MKVKFRASSLPMKEGTLFYQVIHGRVARQVNTGYKVYPCEWDAVHAEIIFPPGIEDSRNIYLASLKETLYENDKRFKNIIARLECAGEDYTAEDVLRYYLTPSDSKGFLSFAREVIRQMGQIGKPRTAERYTVVIRSFERFCGKNDVLLEEVNSDLMVRYENFLKTAGVCPNTTSYYMRGLRAIYNRAVEKELTMQRSPFKHVYTGIDKTVKRAVPLNIIRQIEHIADYDENTQSCGPGGIYSNYLFEFYTNPDKNQSIIFPQTGYRDWDDMVNTYHFNIKGYVWAAGNVKNDDNRSYNFEFSRTDGTGYVRPQNNFFPCDGFPVRPVRNGSHGE